MKFREGDVDLRGLLELANDVRNGFWDIRGKFRLKMDAADKKLELLEKLCKTSPVFDTITRFL